MNKKNAAHTGQQSEAEKTGVNTTTPVWQTHRRKLAIGIALDKHKK
jgi:hypothetical protein